MKFMSILTLEYMPKFITKDNFPDWESMLNSVEKDIIMTLFHKLVYHKSIMETSEGFSSDEIMIEYLTNEVMKHIVSSYSHKGDNSFEEKLRKYVTIMCDYFNTILNFYKYRNLQFIGWFDGDDQPEDSFGIVYPEYGSKISEYDSSLGDVYYKILVNI